MTTLVKQPLADPLGAELPMLARLITVAGGEDGNPAEDDDIAARFIAIPCRMGFAEQGMLLALAESNGCPQGSLICKPIEPGEDTVIVTPDEFFNLETMIEARTRADIGERDQEGRLPEVTVNPFSVGGWDTLRRLAVTDEVGAEEAAAWVDGLNRMMNRTEARIDADGADAGLPPGQVTMQLCCQIADRVDPEELPVNIDYDLLTRFCVREQLQEAIAAAAPAPPAPPRHTALELLGADRTAGIKFATGARHRSMLISAAGDRASLLAPYARRNDALVRRIFAPMTRTPVEKIAAAMLSTEAWDAMNEKIARYEADRGPDPAALGIAEPWQQQVAHEASRILGDVFGGGYRPEVNLHVIGEHDLLMVRDHEGHYLYTWPSRDRQVLFAPDEGVQIPMINPDEYPGDEELAGLRNDLSRRMQELAEIGAAEERVWQLGDEAEQELQRIRQTAEQSQTAEREPAPAAAPVLDKSLFAGLDRTAPGDDSAPSPG